MKRIISGVCVLCFLTCAGIARGGEKIATSGLLELKTRVRTFQEFLLQHDPKAKSEGWGDLAKFSKDHPDISVLVSTDRRLKGLRYVVSWESLFSVRDREISLPRNDEPIVSLDRLFQPLDPARLRMPGDLDFAVFDEDGTLIEPADGVNSLTQGFVLDLNGDGAVELAEGKEFGSVHYVLVRELTGQKPLLAVAYEWGGRGKKGEPWGYAVRDANGDGIYDIVFGQKAIDSILPEVVFRWDAASGTWTCQDPGEHLRVFALPSVPGQGNVWREIEKLEAEAAMAKERGNPGAATPLKSPAKAP